jgi:hypothetical protein
MRSLIRGLAPLIAAGIAAAPQAVFAQGSAGLDAQKGSVGVCVRWTDEDAHHVADAVVVDPSGDPVLDAAIGPTVEGLSWDKPESYDGGWVGVRISVGDKASADPLPDCTRMLAEPAAGPSAAGKTAKDLDSSLRPA